MKDKNKQWFASEADPTGPDKMRRAYAAAGDMLRAKLSVEAPEDLADLGTVEAADVVVVRGEYDRVEQVLEALGTPFTLIDPPDVDRVNLRPEQLLIVNCPGHISTRAIGKIRAFVEAGGGLFTTDWALKHVLEPAFPGMLVYNERPTADDVVRIEVTEHDNPFLQGVLGPGSDPLWWLEGSSQPIRVLDREQVRVLLSSRELGQKYGETPVAVVFPWGQGEVFHMVSHYYLQRSELRTARHAAPAAEFAKELAVEGAVQACAARMEDLSLADVESAYSSMRMMENVILAKKRRGKGAS